MKLSEIKPTAKAKILRVLSDIDFEIDKKLILQYRGLVYAIKFAKSATHTFTPLQITAMNNSLTNQISTFTNIIDQYISDLQLYASFNDKYINKQIAKAKKMKDNIQSLHSSFILIH